MQDALRSLDGAARARVDGMRRTMDEQVEAVVREGVEAGGLGHDHGDLALRMLAPLPIPPQHALEEDL